MTQHPTPRARGARTRLLAALAATGLAAVGLTSPTTASASSSSGPAPQPASTRFYTPPAPDGSMRQIRHLRHTSPRDARLVQRMVDTPQAVWLTSGTPRQVQRDVARTMHRARRHASVPVFVLYNIPGRDCAQYSAGGATSPAAYDAWVDAVARGIGHGRAVALIEPDSLGLLPSTCATKSPATDAERYAELQHAVTALGRLPHVSTYLDGTNSNWLGVGDIARRLDTAGVRRATGFFLNVSNYETTPRQVKFGTWISECLAFAANGADGGWRLGHYDYCTGQYSPASPDDFSTWGKSDAFYQQNLGAAKPTAHFVIDTSRNGNGPAQMSVYGRAPFNQSAATVSALTAGKWCNAPGAGLGLRPTARTGVPLVDAYLWVKTPGQSDGSCDIAGGARAWDYTAYTRSGWPTTTDAQQHFDPLWGMVDPAAGAWFGQQAIQLARLANPALPARHR